MRRTSDRNAAAWLRHLIRSARTEAELRALEPRVAMLDEAMSAAQTRADFDRRLGLLAVGAGPRPRKRLLQTEARRLAVAIHRSVNIDEICAIAEVVAVRYPTDPGVATIEALCRDRCDALRRLQSRAG